MTDPLPGVLQPWALITRSDAYIVPALIADAGDDAGWRYVEFFTANIRNPHTRRALAHFIKDAGIFTALEGIGKVLFRFHRSIRIAPGLRLNIGKRSLSTPFGRRGAHVTVGHNTTRATVSAPGTGLCYTVMRAHGCSALPS